MSTILESLTQNLSREKYHTHAQGNNADIKHYV